MGKASAKHKDGEPTRAAIILLTLLHATLAEHTSAGYSRRPETHDAPLSQVQCHSPSVTVGI